ncbi:MAG: HD domain-containing protein [Nitrospirae bacterium]|nr:HD domain-containing protein [Nitrospirota bacterium]
MEARPLIRKNENEQDRLHVRSIARSVLTEFRDFVELLRNQRDIRDHRLFSVYSTLAEDIPIRRRFWLEFVFRPTPEPVNGERLSVEALNVSILSMEIGRDLGYAGRDLMLLGMGALLHDIGLFDVPHQVLEVERAFTPEERSIVSRHPEQGFKLLRHSGLSRSFSEVVLQEHERQDGSGYPFKLKGPEIHGFASIVGYCDTIESMTHPRPHRKARPFIRAFTDLLHEHKAQFPREIWSAGLRRITPYPPGTMVRLSNGQLGRVYEPDPETLMRPTVEVLQSEKDPEGDVLLDLRRYPLVTIQEALA